MTPLYLKILLLILPIVLYTQVISPLYSGGGQLYVPDNNIKSSRELISQYDGALKQASTLIEQGDILKKDYKEFDEGTKAKLNTMIPSYIDQIMMTDELAELVSKSDIKIETTLGIRAANDSSYADLIAYDVGFKVSGSYEDFKKVLKLIESSLRLYDIEGVKFTAPDTEKEGSISEMTVSTKTYILK